MASALLETPRMFPLIVTVLLGAELQLGPETQVDSPLDVRSDAHDWHGVAVASGDDALVAFFSERRGQADLWVAFVARNGVVSFAIRVSDDDELNSIVPPSYACNQTTCLVAWQSKSSPKGDLKFRRMTIRGQLIDQTDRDLAVTEGDESNPHLVSTNTGFAVAYALATGNGYEVAVTKIDAAGTVSPSVVLGQGMSHAITATPTGIAVTFSIPTNEVRLVRLSSELATVGTLDLTPAGPPTEDISRTSIASFGDRLLVTYTVFRPNGGNGAETSDVFALRVGPAGVLDAAPLAIATEPSLEHDSEVVATTTGFLISWIRGGDSSHRRTVDPATGALGVVRPLFSRRVPSYGIVTVVPIGDALLALGDGLYPGLTVSFDTKWIEPTEERAVLVPHAGHAQRQPALTAMGEQFLVVWQDRRNIEQNHDDLYFARLETNGFPKGAAVALFPDRAFQGFPAVAAHASMALVAWYDERNGRSEIRAARISRDGAVLDSESLLIARADSDLRPSLVMPAVATDGTDFLVGWSVPNEDDTRIARVRADGTVDAERALKTGSVGGPAIAFSGDTFLVATTAFLPSGASALSTTMVTFDGAAPTPRQLFTTAAPMVAPRASFDGKVFWVAWEDHRVRPADSDSSEDVLAIRVDRAGQSLDGTGFVISREAGVQGAPVLAFDGKAMHVAWHDYRSALDTGVQLVRLDEQAPAVVQQLVVSAVPRMRQITSQLAFTKSGLGLVIFERFIPIEASAQRLLVRTVRSPEPFEHAATTDTDAAANPAAEQLARRACGCSSTGPALLALLALLLRRHRKG